MRMIKGIAACIGAALLLAACGGGSGDVGQELGLQNPLMHFINAFPAGPNLDLLVNGTAPSGQTNVPYKGVTNLTNVNTGSTVVAYTATGTMSPQLASGTFPDVAKGHEYTVIALPSTSGYGIGLIDDPFDKGLLSSKARVRSFNASANASNLDIYIVAPGTPSVVGMSPTMAGVSYGNAVPPSGQDSSYLSGGTYMAIVTTAGSSTPIYESAPFSLGNNADWLITTVPANTSVSALTNQQIHLLIAQAGNTSQPAIELTNALTGQ